jgi:peptide-methionine (S)-S-oxide reductase
MFPWLDHTQQIFAHFSAWVQIFSRWVCQNKSWNGAGTGSDTVKNKNQQFFQLKPWLMVVCIAFLGLISCTHSPSLEASASTEGLAKATFAGGCFWCMEKPFDELEGVVSTTSGYTGGTVTNPTYKQVSSGSTGHAESVQILYDPKKVSYEKLLDVFWHNVDPVDEGGQFCDRGTQYRSGVFYQDETQKKLAENSKAALTKSGTLKKSIETSIVAASTFYPAEDYHQDYYKKNPLQYNFYRTTCGRDRRLKEVWGAEISTKH